MGGVAVRLPRAGLRLDRLGNVLRADVYPTLGTALRRSHREGNPGERCLAAETLGHLLLLLADAGVAQIATLEWLLPVLRSHSTSASPPPLPRGVEPKPRPELPKLAELSGPRVKLRNSDARRRERKIAA